MLDDRVRDRLKRLCGTDGGKVIFDHPLCGHSTIAIGGNASAWYVPSSLEELREAKIFLKDSGVRTMVIGRGSNLLIPDEGLDAVIISLSNAFFGEIGFTARGIATVGAGADLGGLIASCCARGLAGMEGLIGIPATVGGALATNASYRTAISDRLSRLLALGPDGKLKWLEREELNFEYRSSPVDRDEIVLRAEFSLDEAPPEVLRKKCRDYFAEKRRAQPLDRKTLGCVFKNPVGDNGRTSGELIDAAGLKGARRGGALISERHANFIVNSGGANCRDVKALMDQARSRVRKRFSIELEPEIEIL